MKIETNYHSTPALFAAYDADTYDGAEDAGAQCVGWGRTEAEAINDLVEQLDEAAYERGWKDAERIAAKQGLAVRGVT